MKKTIYSFAFIFLSFILFSQNEKINTLFKYELKTTVSTSDIDSVLLICRGLRTSEPQTGIKFCRWAEIKSAEINYQKGIGESNKVIGLIKRIQGEYDSALFYLTMSEKKFLALKESIGLAEVYNSLAITYESKDDYKNSISYQIKALGIFEKLNSKSGMADCYGNLGILYINQNLFDEALKNQEKALAIYKEIKNADGETNTYCNIGIIYGNRKERKKALEYFLEAAQIAEKSGNKHGLGAIYTNVGLIYSDLLEVKSALAYQDKALAIYKDLSDDQGISVTYLNKADILQGQGKTDEAIKNYFESVKVSLKARIKDNLISSYQGLAKCYADKKDYKTSNEYLLKFIAVKDTVLNEGNTQQIREIETKYQTEKKELEIKNLNTAKGAQETELKRQKTVLIAVGVTALLLLFFVIFIFKAYEQKKKDNFTITEQKHLVEEKQKEILDSIHYAKRIQTALLPTEKYIERTLSEVKEKDPGNSKSKK